MNPVFFKLIFWASACLLLYVHFGYPLLLSLPARRRREPELQGGAPPHVSFLISAYNEREVIGRKLENALATNYPQDRREIIVISDCSDDGTDDIVRGFARRGVCLLRLTERLGKSSGLNQGVMQSKGEILIFSDANAIYQPNAFVHLTSHFADPHVGYVVGNARYVESVEEPSAAKSEGLYWRLETWLKEKESDFGSVVGGDGAIYAIRKELFEPLRPTDINDFLNPLQIILRGYRGVYEPAAVCFEEAGDSFEKEFRRKVRIISRSLNAVSRVPRILLPWVQPRHWLSLISHKVLRWFVPVYLILFLAGSAALSASPFYRLALWTQIVFYGLAIGGWLLERFGRTGKIFYLPFYFCTVNLASLIGILRFFTGSLSPTWQTIRQPEVRDPNIPVQRKESQT